jgi:hypothetical protein
LYFVFNRDQFVRIPKYSIIRQIKSRRIGWAGHVARMGEERKVYKVFAGKPEGETSPKTEA